MKPIFLSPLLLIPFWIVKRDVTFYATIHHRNHTEIFEFVSMPENLQVLNPTILNVTYWEMINETDFVIEYTEYLSQVPAVENYARGHYRVGEDGDGSHRLHSQHLTCFYTDLLCLPTESTIQISQNSGQKVGYRERILYSCSWILIKFCLEEIKFQRQLIISKLKEIFSQNYP